MVICVVFPLLLFVSSLLCLRHQSGSKVRQSDSVHKLVDEDGNVVLVVCDMQDTQNYNCCIINEVAENSSNCQVTAGFFLGS